MPPASRPLNPVEQKVHQACLSNDKKMLGQKDIDVLVPDVNVRVAAINFLLSTGMLKAMQDGGKQISYKAVMKKEVEIKKEMGGDENMVLNHIQSSSNEGIWTKHLKGKTELHQTVINRCLKSLEQKGLIKVVKSVKYPTRKIYMMSHLEPSVEVTGGPWYSENELDTEFIKMLTSACLRFIQDKSYPKSTSWETGAPSASTAPLYPISQSSSYPTSKQIHSWLQKSRLSEQQLGVEHVEMLLDVLVFDGEIERLPAYGSAMWDMGAMDGDSEEERKEKKRRKKIEQEEKRKKKGKGKKRARKADSSEEESSEDEVRQKKKRRKVKEEEDSDDSEGEKKKSKSRKRKRKDSDDDSDSESGSDSADDRKKLKKRKKTSSRSKSKSKRRSSSSSDSDSESESSDSSSAARKKKKKTTSSKSTSKSKAKTVFDLDSQHENSDAEGMVTIGSVNVYRAVRQERVSLGWSQAPCGRCPVFEFCHEDGPVNPKECTYYGDWLPQGVAEF